MRSIAPILALALLTSCTNVGQVQEDLGDARQVIKDSIGRQVEAVGWRDMEVLAVHRARTAALMDAADDAADAGDMETAKRLWQEALDGLDAFRPVETKIENIGRVAGKVRELHEATELEEPPETR